MGGFEVGWAGLGSFGVVWGLWGLGAGVEELKTEGRPFCLVIVRVGSGGAVGAGLRLGERP